MNDVFQPIARDSLLGRIAIIAALTAIALLLLAILFVLLSISRDGLNLRLGGDLTLGEIGDRITVELTMDEPIALALPQPLQMVATGPDEQPIPATLAFASCPICNGPMLPSSWNLWDGRIEWTCPACNSAPKTDPAP